MMIRAKNSVVLEDLKRLGYHEIMDINKDTKVMRVPDGLIYITFYSYCKTSSSVFVPFKSDPYFTT